MVRCERIVSNEKLLYAMRLKDRKCQIDQNLRK